MARIATIEELAPFAGVKDSSAGLTGINLQTSLDMVEQFCERWCGRTFSPDPPLVSGVDSGSPVTKRFSARGKRIVRVPDLREATSVKLDGTALTRDSTYWFDAYVEPATQLELEQLVSPSSGVRGELEITGRWGFNPPPSDVKGAILLLAGRVYRRKDAMFSDTIQTAEGAVFFFTQALPQEAKAVFESYRTPNFAVV